jgi:hypothetical protein
MKISKTTFIKSSTNYRKQWKLLDNILLSFCRKNLQHTQLDYVSAKVLLIGRGFATGIERHINSEGTQGSSIDKLSNHLVANFREIDRIIDKLVCISEPLTIAKLSEIVKYHGDICRILAKLTRDHHYVTSFVAKYLHFHAPVVPIYDSISYKNAWHYRDKQALESFRKPKGSDENYFYYSLCFWQYYDALRKRFNSCNVRLAEVYLMWL